MMSPEIPFNRRWRKDMSFVCMCVRVGLEISPPLSTKNFVDTRARACIRVRRNSGIGCIYFWLLMCVRWWQPCGGYTTHTHKWFYGGMFLWQITGGAVAQRRAISFNFYIFSLWVYDFFFFPYIPQTNSAFERYPIYIFFIKVSARAQIQFWFRLNVVKKKL